MSPLLLSSISALWFGILTSISPCPLATNIAATSFIGSRLGTSRQILLSGVLYTAGRSLTYIVIGILLAASVMSTPAVSNALQRHMNKALGPILIVVGVILLELISLPFFGRGVGERTQKRVEQCGIWGAALLGVIFALSFCPVSAAYFFGGVLPVSLQHGMGGAAHIFAVYGIGTALPVMGFAFLLAFGAQSVGKAFNKLTLIEKWARRVTGVVFIAAGIYCSLKYIFELI